MLDSSLSMENVTQALATTLTMLTLASIIGGALIYARGSFNKTHLQELREDNNDLRARVKDCEEQIESARRREGELQQELSHLKDENLLLANMITQRANVEALLDILENHHAEAVNAWTAIRETLERMNRGHV